MVRQRVEPVMAELEIKDYQILESITGKNHEGTAYEYPLKDIIPNRQNSKPNIPSSTICRRRIRRHRNCNRRRSPFTRQRRRRFLGSTTQSVPIYAPYDDEVKFTKVAEYSTAFLHGCRHASCRRTAQSYSFVKIKKAKHEYPTCWRSHHKLVWLARKEYFLRTDKLNQKVLEAADKVQYFYDEPKNRFLAS
jgi:isoleucyl-tRNA synthetase